MGWLASILGTDGVVSGIKDGIDKSILTDEERLDYHKEMLKAYEPFKLIQRGLALAVTALFGFVLIVQVILVLLSGYFSFALDMVEEINSLDSVSTVGMSFLAIMSLYFSGGVINSFMSRDKK